MIGIDNKDTSFFTVDSSDVSLSGIDMARRLISLTINEKSAGMPTGTLSFFDPDDIYSRILRTGVELSITWGYKSFLNQFDDAKKINIDEVSGSLIRRGFKGFVSSPSGGGDVKGVKIFNCNFTAYGFRGEAGTKIFYPNDGSKKDVVDLTLDEIGVGRANRFVDFSIMAEKIPEHGVRRDETPFLFLNKLAKEWRAFFQIGFTPIGLPYAIFVDPNKIGESNYQSMVLGAIGKSNVIGYKGVINNVISYTWSSNESESGVGDNVRADIVDGQIIFRKFSSEQKKVIAYRLDEAKIKRSFDNVNSFESQLKLTNELLSKKDFASIKHYFIPVESTTAPMGAGFKISCNMIGNPLFSPPNQVVVNNGFPDVLGGVDSVWYIQDVSHIINRSGYNMSVNIADVFTLSPIGLPVR